MADKFMVFDVESIGLHGDFVVLGQSTSKMSIREMSDLMELMSAFGAERGVRFTAPEYA